MHSDPAGSPPSSWHDTQRDLRAAQEGDRDAMQRVMTRYHAPLLARIRLMAGAEARRAAESSDFLQQMYLEAMTSLPRLQPKDENHVIAWLTQIARNNIRDEIRRKREDLFSTFTQETLGGVRGAGTPTPPSELARAEERELLLGALLALDSDHRRVIELRAFERLAFKDIGLLMERSAEAAERLHARAMMRLGHELRRLHGAGGAADTDDRKL
jgi:RNA polymerase sigma factor (sigma-70 family)